MLFTEEVRTFHKECALFPNCNSIVRVILTDDEYISVEANEKITKRVRCDVCKFTMSTAVTKPSTTYNLSKWFDVEYTP